jgi:hypothetical protein
MNVTEEQLKLLKAISNLGKLSYPSTDDLKAKAKPLIDAGLVELLIRH